MSNFTIYKNQKFFQTLYDLESELTSTFQKYYRSIVCQKSFFISRELQFKTRNFKNSKCDGLLFVWENPSTPRLYITEIELEKHDVNRHILPQLGDFISFIQTNDSGELDRVRTLIYEELKLDKKLFKGIQDETEKEVYELIQTAMEDLQILLVIDKMPANLTIGLSQIEKAININIRKIEIIRYKNKDNDEETISYTDNEALFEGEDEPSSTATKDIQYTIEHHIGNKPLEILSLFTAITNMVIDKLIISPQKLYIGLFNDKWMVFAIIVMYKKIILYSKESFKKIEEKYRSLFIRDVSEIGHYCNHLPTEITVTPQTDMKILNEYVEKVIDVMGGKVEGVDNSQVLMRSE